MSLPLTSQTHSLWFLSTHCLSHDMYAAVALNYIRLLLLQQQANEVVVGDGDDDDVRTV